MIIETGNGEYNFSVGKDHAGRLGLFIKKNIKPKQFASLSPDELGVTFNLTEEDIFIIIPNLECLLIIQEQLVAVGVELLGWEKER
jgi:hypothetical protein